MKARILLTALALALPLAGAKAQWPNPPAGLISWWRGEGNTTDETGAHPGAAVGGLTFAPGRVGQAFVLNGQNAAVALGNWFDLQQFTISLWVKAEASQVQYADILDNVHSDNRSWVIQYSNLSDATRTWWHWGTSIPSGSGPMTFVLTNGIWQHWVVTLGADRGHHLYLDGKLCVATTNTAAIPYDGTQYFNLGKHQIYGRYFNGMVDELMVFDHALDPAEVLSIYVGQGGRPTLNIRSQSSAVVLSWPASAEGWLLHATTNLVTGGSVWTEIPPAYQTNGANLQFTELLSVGNKFYRLHKP